MKAASFLNIAQKHNAIFADVHAGRHIHFEVRPSQDATLQHMTFEKALSAFALGRIGEYQAKTTGWVPMFESVNEDGDGIKRYMIDLPGGIILTCFGMTVRRVPNSEVEAEVARRVRRIEREESTETETRKVAKAERTRIKEQVITAMLPKTLPVTTLRYVWIDTRRQLIGVNSANPGDLEEPVAFLRGLMGGLRATDFAHTGNLASHEITDWMNKALQGKALPDGIKVLDQVSLVGHDNETVNFKGYDPLATESFREAVREGNSVASIRLRLFDSLEATLTTKTLSLRTIKFNDDRVNEELGEDGDDDFHLSRTAVLIELIDGAADTLANELLGGRKIPGDEEEEVAPAEPAEV